MSAELIKARSRISKVGSYLKQGKPLPAVTALYEAVLGILKTPLMRAEKDEFSKLIHDAVLLLNNNKKLRIHYPLIIQYTTGDEKLLAEILKEILDILQSTVVDEAKDIIAGRAERVERDLTESKRLIQDGKIDEAKILLDKLASDFPNDAEIKAHVAEQFIQAELFEDAFVHLDEAIDISPDQIHLYNRIGIVLRKLGNYDVAEKYFMRAVGYAKNDPNLYFNIGRLYVDWARWDKVEKAAQIALRIRPDFVEAQKMLTFAQKKQSKPA